MSQLPLLERVRDINKIMLKAAGHPISFMEMAETLSRNLDANVYITSRKGGVLGYAFMDGFHCPTMEDIMQQDSRYPASYLHDLMQITETRVNINREGKCVFGVHDHCFLPNKYTTVIPMIGGGQRLGTLVLSKSGQFLDDDLILAEVASTVIGMEILRARIEKVEENARQKAMVGVAFDTLSYSELEAVEHIFSELGGSDGLLVASKVADKVGITRSVIVNALRKLESAGVVEVRSLGMKGTYIRVLNEYLMEELERIQAAHRHY